MFCMRTKIFGINIKYVKNYISAIYWQKPNDFCHVFPCELMVVDGDFIVVNGDLLVADGELLVVDGGYFFDYTDYSCFVFLSALMRAFAILS